MNRWWGSKSDSLEQASQRDRRAARRTIAALPVISSDDDDQYEDCNLSVSHFPNLDGQGDEDEVETSSNAGSENGEAMPVVIFQDENGTDDDDYYKKLGSLRNRNFNKQEVEFWFTSFETSLKHIGVKSQWSKREVLHSLLPDDVQISVKNLLKKNQANAGTHPYKTLKQELIKQYAPKPQAAFETALGRQMSDLPSTLLKSIIDDLCVCAEPLASACCQRIIWGMWSRKLPDNVRQKLAGRSFTNDTYEELMELADDTYTTGKTSFSPAPVVVAAATTSSGLDETQPALPYAVNAVNRGNGRGNRRGRGQRGNRGAGRGQNRGGQNQNQNSSNSSNSKWPTPRHADVPNALKEMCFNHHTYGRGAYHCTDPLVCPWSSIPPAPRQKPVDK